MVKCADCGLLDKKEDKGYCVRLKKEIVGQEIYQERDCHYFYKRIVEDNEPLSPEEHLVMQDMEIKSKKLKFD